MKKFIAILTLAALAAVSGCGGSASKQTVTEDDGKQTMVAYQIEDTSSEALDFIKGKSPLFYKYLQKRRRAPITLISSQTVNGKELTYGTYIKDATNAALYSTNEDGTRTIVVYNGDKGYQIEESEKAVYVIDYGEKNVRSAIESNLLKIQVAEALDSKYASGVENIDGVDYDFESIEYKDETSYFYFEHGSGEIRYMKSGGVLTKIVEFKNSVTDESLFEIPADYERRTFEDLMAKYAAEEKAAEEG